MLAMVSSLMVSMEYCRLVGVFGKRIQACLYCQAQVQVLVPGQVQVRSRSGPRSHSPPPTKLFLIH